MPPTSMASNDLYCPFLALPIARREIEGVRIEFCVCGRWDLGEKKKNKNEAEKRYEAGWTVKKIIVSLIQ